MTGTHPARTSAALTFGLVVALAALLGAGERGARAQTPDYAALLAAPDRSEADRKADQRRDPLPFLIFTAARPGMKVLDMGAGGGYSTELMARAVAPNGTVYAQNPTDLGERGKTAVEARLKSAAMKNAVALWRPFDDPVPPEVHDLDMITFLFAYHDTTYMNVDRAAMNHKLLAALRPGGILVIADHSAKTGDGISVAKTLHRIEESALRSEIEAAGFRLVGQGDFWRHPDDTRDFVSFRPTGPLDNFVLKFQRPM